MNAQGFAEGLRKPPALDYYNHPNPDREFDRFDYLR